SPAPIRMATAPPAPTYVPGCLRYASSGTFGPDGLCFAAASAASSGPGPVATGVQVGGLGVEDPGLTFPPAATATPVGPSSFAGSMDDCRSAFPPSSRVTCCCPEKPSAVALSR